MSAVARKTVEQSKNSRDHDAVSSSDTKRQRRRKKTKRGHDTPLNQLPYSAGGIPNALDADNPLALLQLNNVGFRITAELNSLLRREKPGLTPQEVYDKGQSLLSKLELCAPSLTDLDIRVNALYSIQEFYYVHQQFPKALEYANQIVQLEEDQLAREITGRPAREADEKADQSQDKALEQERRRRQSCQKIRLSIACGVKGNALVALGKPQDALPWFEKTLSLQQQVHGPEHESMIATYSCLAEVHSQLSQMDKLLHTSRVALSLRQRYRPKDVIGIADSKFNIASAYLVTGKRKEALRIHAEVLETYKAHLGRHTKVAQVLISTGTCHADDGSGEESLPYLHEALAILRSLGDATNVAFVLHILATVLLSLNRMREAQPLYKEALQIRRQKGHELDAAETLHKLGLLCTRQCTLNDESESGSGGCGASRSDEKNSDKATATQAAEFFNESYNMRRRLLGEDHEDTRDVLACHAWVLAELLDDPAQALKLARKALDGLPADSSGQVADWQSKTLRNIEKWEKRC